MGDRPVAHTINAVASTINPARTINPVARMDGKKGELHLVDK